jgi:hypothetical protein
MSKQAGSKTTSFSPNKLNPESNLIQWNERGRINGKKEPFHLFFLSEISFLANEERLKR